jgi:putative membrane protein
MKRIGLLSIAFAAMISMACGDGRRNENTAGQPGAVGTSGENADRTADRGTRNFVDHAIVAGMAEVQLGNLASERAASKDVKQFGQMMVKDHTAAGDELKQIAAQQYVPVPTQLDDKHRDLYDKLSKLQGAEFDKEYIDAMIDGHQEFINELEKHVDEKNVSGTSGKVDMTPDRNAKDKDKTIVPEKADDHAEARVNAWAANTLPVARRHLERANQIKDSLGKRQTY